MKKIFEKLKFFFEKPKLIVVAGSAQKTAKTAIASVVGKEVLVLESSSKKPNDWKFFLKRSQLPIVVVSHIGEYHPEKEFFAGELKDAKEINVLVKVLPPHGHLVLNYDDETVRDMHGKSQAHPLFFGLGARADIQVSDIVLTQFPGPGTNFKINYKGKIVPVWLEKLFGKENIYAALAAAGVGEILGLNLVEISSALKRYVGVPGRMKLIRGIKQSFILDDSENASVLSMAEGLNLLKRIKAPGPPAQAGKKIAVLGDIIGVGKYAIEAHEAIGESVSLSADLLFTVGGRAKFFAEGARKKGMASERIFEFYEVGPAGLALQEKLTQGDLILIDGSKEMSMTDIVKEVKAGPIV